ncbi:MAG: DUF4168 domain-containing protein [Wenzhouxiangellaceae bacterium]
MKIFLSAISLALGLALAAPVAAQQAAPPPQPAQQEIEVTDSDLDSFADAQMSIMQIQQDYSQRLQNADNPDAANQLQQEANEKMVGAVEEAGLDVESFNAIAMAIQNDPELQQRLQEML